MDSEVVVEVCVCVGGWVAGFVWGGQQHTTEMPAVPINHSLPMIDSANVVWKRQRKLEGIDHCAPKTFQPPQF